MDTSIRFLVTGMAAALAAGAAGCGAVTAPPDSFAVSTSASERVVAEAGTGPSGLADSTWSLERVAEDDDEPEDEGDSTPRGPYGGLLDGDALERPPVGERIFLVHFGSEGQMVRVTENRFFLPQFYGREVEVGTSWTGTTLPGVTYRSKTYGVQDGDRFGLAVVVHVQFGGVFLGKAILYSWGTVQEDRLEGQFGYLLDFTDGAARWLGTVADQYPIEAARIEP